MAGNSPAPRTAYVTAEPHEAPASLLLPIADPIVPFEPLRLGLILLPHDGLLNI